MSRPHPFASSYRGAGVAGTCVEYPVGEDVGDWVGDEDGVGDGHDSPAPAHEPSSQQVESFGQQLPVPQHFESVLWQQFCPFMDPEQHSVPTPHPYFPPSELVQTFPG